MGTRNGGDSGREAQCPVSGFAGDHFPSEWRGPWTNRQGMPVAHTTNLIDG